VDANAQADALICARADDMGAAMVGNPEISAGRIHSAYLAARAAIPLHSKTLFAGQNIAPAFSAGCNKFGGCSI
jgi:hypothetical protein